MSTDSIVSTVTVVGPLTTELKYFQDRAFWSRWRRAAILFVCEYIGGICEFGKVK